MLFQLSGRNFEKMPYFYDEILILKNKGRTSYSSLYRKRLQRIITTTDRVFFHAE